MGKYKHGDTGTRLHVIWNCMTYRCSKGSRHKEYNAYGGKGIVVCPEWHDYINFKQWALAHGYRDDLTLERMDNNGSYSPSNCIWIPRHEQALNRNNTIYVKVSLPLKVVCRLYNLSYSSTRIRLSKGQDIQEIIKKRRR